VALVRQITLVGEAAVLVQLVAMVLAVQAVTVERV
jgi:hypothetical protein